jgi:hypothetical protein
MAVIGPQQYRQMAGAGLLQVPAFEQASMRLRVETVIALAIFLAAVVVLRAFFRRLKKHGFKKL